MSSRSDYRNGNRGLAGARAASRNTLGEAAFHRMISLERRRTGRSQKSFLLMLLDLGEHRVSDKDRRSLHKILNSLTPILRETDVTGWYKEEAVIGVLLTEVEAENEHAVPGIMMTRVSEALKSHLTPEQFQKLGISFHLLSEAHDNDRSRTAHLAV